MVGRMNPEITQGQGRPISYVRVNSAMKHDNKYVAMHEAGHAGIGLLLGSPQDPVTNSGGFALAIPFGNFLKTLA